MPKYNHPDILNLIDPKLDQKIRNSCIRALWEFMSDQTDRKYKAKVTYLATLYHLSFSRIEDIIQKDFGDEGEG